MSQETTFVKCQNADLIEVKGDRLQFDFLEAISKVTTAFSNYQDNHILIELTSFPSLVQKYRDFVQNTKTRVQEQLKGRGATFPAILQGRDKNSNLVYKSDNNQGNQTNRSSKQKRENYIYGNRYYSLKKCFYLYLSLKPDNQTLNQLTAENVAKAIEDLAIYKRVEDSRRKVAKNAKESKDSKEQALSAVFIGGICTNTRTASIIREKQ